MNLTCVRETFNCVGFEDFCDFLAHHLELDALCLSLEADDVILFEVRKEFFLEATPEDLDALNDFKNNPTLCVDSIELFLSELACENYCNEGVYLVS